ncbi:hypothetical protein PFISCL1PPCAC_26524, partial [Pristionchus fissidentatus]
SFLASFLPFSSIMSSTVQLESKQKLPQKVTDVVCDISSMINNAVATSNSNDLMSSSFKAIVGSESLIENSSKLLESIGSMLTEMDSKFSRGGQLEHGVMMLSDAQEALQRLERVVYHDATGNKMQLNEADEEWRRRARDGWNERCSGTASCSPKTTKNS